MHRMKWWHIAIYLAGPVLLAGCGWVGQPDERVLFPSEPDAREYLYVDLARQIASEKPCYLISPASISVAPLSSPGTRAAQLRSRCFATVAQRAARPELCKQVGSVSTLFYSGNANSQERCIQEASQGRPRAGAGMIDHDALFVLAGFSEAEIDALMLAHQLPKNGRYCLVFSPEFFDAIEQMPRFASEDELIGMDDLKWEPHPFLAVPGFPCTGKFLDGPGGKKRTLMISPD
ncbi:hypothetical protein [Thioalkalivibrio sp. HL-Eb18]|uniref:hypothetical protein n=1 Tax=Thioalkalivibrio sp. HL-Eb18 TaxID=1266913 RepID=UPI000366F4A5|nr:hypothetical protein [Thioalkalivibrio sp. HL-Eb18]